MKDMAGLSDLYEYGASLEDLAWWFSVSRGMIRKLLTERGIEIRSRGQSKGCRGKRGAESNWYKGKRVSDKRARDAVFDARRKGELEPQPCEVCGEMKKTKDGFLNVEAHHDDYNYPLKVRWLCRKHHFAWHEKNEPIQRYSPEK